MTPLKVKILIGTIAVAAFALIGFSLSAGGSGGGSEAVAKSADRSILPVAPTKAPPPAAERPAPAPKAPTPPDVVVSRGGGMASYLVTALIALGVSAVVSFLFNLFGWGRPKGPLVQAGPTVEQPVPTVEQPHGGNNFNFEATRSVNQPAAPDNPFALGSKPVDAIPASGGDGESQDRMAKIAQRALTPTPVRQSNPSYVLPQDYAQPSQASGLADAERQRAEQAAFQAQQQSALDARNRQAAAVSQFQSEFCAMVDRGGLSRKTFEDFLLAHGTVLWVSGIEGSRVSLSDEPVDNDLLLVLQLHSAGNSVLLPSYSFISDFPGLYTKARDVPRDVLAAFELGDGGHHTLRIDRLGTVSVQGDGFVLDEPRGQLSGISA